MKQISSLKTLAAQLGDALKAQGLLLATAESCTGGGLGYWITSIPGSSSWFDRGFITYSDLAKVEQLAVPAETIAAFGAVSEETACAMAEGTLKHSRADLSIAITGIAGPEGGSLQKPVGTVWIAWAKRDDFIKIAVNLFPGDRESIRKQAIHLAMERLIELIYTKRA